MTDPPATPPEKLRIGLLLDSFEVPAWIYAVIEQVSRSPHSAVSLVVVNVRPPVPGFWEKLHTRRRFLLFSFYAKLERALFRQSEVADPFAPRDARPLLSAAPIVDVIPLRARFTDVIGADDIDRIRSHKVDVFLRFGFRILKGDILTAARFGVWSYHHGDNRVNRGGPAGVWEVLLEHPVTGSTLQILTNELDGGNVLYRSLAATHPEQVHRNLYPYYWKSVAFVPRQIEKLHRLGGDAFMRELDAVSHAPSFYSHPLYRHPTNWQFAKIIARHLAKTLRTRLAHRLYLDQWQLLYRFGGGVRGSLHRFKRLSPPADRFWADPCVIQRGDDYYVFFEEFVYRRGKGTIGVVRIREDGEVSKITTVLERPYHLSYPFVFEWMGEAYMIPETADNRTIEVYRCKAFPDVWEYHCTLMRDVNAVDTTLLFHEGRWWLFCCIAEHPAASTSDELFLFSADSPLAGEWAPHPQNPIVSDVTRARPAGRLFISAGELYRPSQDCSRRYGSSVVISRVIALTPERYDEIETARIDPMWASDVNGVHTLSHAGALTVVDARFRRFKVQPRRRA